MLLRVGAVPPLADRIGVYRPGTEPFFLPCPPDPPGGPGSAPVGVAGDVPIVGDWDGDGWRTIGVYRPGTSTFLLSNDGLTVARTIRFCAAGDLPVVRRVCGKDGCVDAIGVYRPSTQTFHLSDSNTAPAANHVVPFGAPGDVPLIGEWTGDGVDKVGVYRPSTSTFYLKTTFP